MFTTFQFLHFRLNEPQ